jgi:uncharacterized protein
MDETQNKKQVPWNVWDVIYVIILVFFLNILVAYLFKLAGLELENVFHSGILQVTLSTVPVLVIFIFVKFIRKSSILTSLRLEMPREKLKRYFIGGFNISVLILLTSLIVTNVMVYFTGSPPENPYEKFSVEKLRMISVLAILLSPILEEIFFRGFMQPAFSQALGNFNGIIVVALIFSLLHQQYLGYPHAMAILVSLSLILGISRWYFDSTVPGIIGHLLNNVYATLSVFMGTYG